MSGKIKVVELRNPADGDSFEKKIDELFGCKALEFQPEDFLAGITHAFDEEPKAMLRISDPWGYNDVYLLPNGSLLWGDSDAGLVSITRTPPKDVDKFLEDLEKLIEEVNES